MSPLFETAGKRGSCHRSGRQGRRRADSRSHGHSCSDASPTPCSGWPPARRRCPCTRHLAAKVRSGVVDTARARIAQLDEYVGLPAEHPESYRSVLRREVLEPLGIGMDAFMGPDGTAADVQGRARRTTRRWAGPAGSTSSCWASAPTGTSVSTSRAPRSPRGPGSRRSPSRPASTTRASDGDIEQVPHHVITQGIGTILEARHVVLLATGEGKADAVAASVEGPVAAGARLPHSNCTRTPRWSSTRPPPPS